MAPLNIFQDYDLPHVFNDAQELAVRNDALNFVLEFGAHASNIASNVPSSNFKGLLESTPLHRRSSKTPARWM